MRDAAQVKDATEQMKAVMSLGFAISEERVPIFAQMYAARLGFSSSIAYSFLGYPRTWVADSRSKVDTAFDAVPAASGQVGQVLASARSRVVEARRLVDERGSDQRAVDALASAQQSVEAQTRRLTADLVGRIGAGPIRAGTLRDVLALQYVYDAAVLQTELLKKTFDLTLGQRPSPALLSEVRRQNARYEADVAQIDQIAAPVVRATMASLTNSPVGRILRGRLASTIALDTSRSRAHVDALGLAPDQLDTIALFRTALKLRDQHYQLLADATAQVDRGLSSFQVATRKAYRDAIVQGVLANLLALAFALLLARSVTRPLRLVAARARRVHEGDLRVERESRGGPREVADVARAFDDVAANLRLVEYQAIALARGDTSDPVLRRRVPGILGRSLQDSVAQLSTTLAARDAAEARLRHEATHDRLTDALNRSAAVVALGQSAARVNRAGQGLALLVIDLDGLTGVNGQYGQQVGDQVLIRTARELQKAVREGDVTARIGADEFLVVADVASEQVAVELGRRVATALSVVRFGPAATDVVTVSIGMTLNLDGNVSPAQMLREAEEAARRAHRDGGDRLEFFDDRLRAKLSEQEQMTRALTAALRADELTLVYQPVVDTAGRTVGAEALTRWTDPVLGPVSPGVFIPLAETSELIVELDQWVLRTATAQLARWQQDPLQAGRYLSLNISGRHLLEPSFLTDVTAVLSAGDFDPALLVLEITETVLLDDLVTAAQRLDAVRALGVRVAVDDFGTGYTSVAHLQQLPVDILKIDRSFVTDIITDRGFSLVRLMVDLATSLDMKVVAEGVEEPEELKLLRTLGEPLVQGYLTGRPMAADAIEARSAGDCPENGVTESGSTRRA